MIEVSSKTREILFPVSDQLRSANMPNGMEAFTNGQFMARQKIDIGMRNKHEFGFYEG